MSSKIMRSGRVESVIRVLEQKIVSYESLINSEFKNDTMARLLIENRINENKDVLNMLYETIK